jgi:DNA-binding response OmpR family regulator
MKVLLVEDDPQLGESLHGVLLAQGFASTWVRTAEDAQRFINSESFDIALLDIVLPGASGLDLLRRCRQDGHKLPVLMLTARDTVADRVNGLDMGADDYLPKPFAIEELLSRMRVLLRRSTMHRAADWQVGDLLISTHRHSVALSGTVLELSPREFDLLLILASTPGHAVTRHRLNRSLASTQSADSNALDVHIHSLRKKLGSKRITTVRGVGFILEEKACDDAGR